MRVLLIKNQPLPSKSKDKKRVDLKVIGTCKGGNFFLFTPDLLLCVCFGICFMVLPISTHLGKEDLGNQS